MIDFERLNKSAELLDVKEVAAIFGKSASTILRYDKAGRDGFPQSTTILGNRFWTKNCVTEYIKRKAGDAEKATRLMARGGS